ncbi:phytanoyl-CoA dioxygenase PhyH [Kordia periserrulae]|uniref:Phytanoyl-CoA dioxygenase PhyH n=1 Tax=Kordia periserrulae TaxID=701523 RepID=A0A2T6C5E1_9FLAO|nr:phytanoyl-CoA dioxygenase family protein [Kordia periserrulae]PTX63507.1 phytanoyl-CoA dioxygenase PhyH [Kordia periserrulae]
MNKNVDYISSLDEQGFAVLNHIYADAEVDAIYNCIEKACAKLNVGNYSKSVFAIRQAMKKIPELESLVSTTKLQNLLSSLFTEPYFLTKAIYFDKPSESNWFVAYHQDLSISVDRKVAVSNYTNWTFKKGQYGVQPPLDILENIVTVRIHLDKTTKENGALKVIPTSHLKGIYRPETIDWNTETEHVCEVEKGGIMLMKPLTLHASERTTNGKQRRVLHLEFGSKQLTKPLEWLEFYKI